MKYAIVIFGGASDDPQPDRDGLTPLALAKTPVLDRIAASGRVGQTQMQYPAHGGEPGLVPAMLSLLGYKQAGGALGDGPFLSRGLGIEIEPTDWAFALSLINVTDGVVQAPEALSLSPNEAAALVGDCLEALDLPGAVLHPIAGPLTTPRGMTHLWIDAESCERDWGEVNTHAPRDIVGMPMRKALPVGGNAGDRLQQVIAQSEVVLGQHEINLARQEMGEGMATHLWPWAQGQPVPLESWPEKFGKSGVVLTPSVAMAGVALEAGLEVVLTPRSADEDDAGYFAKLSAEAIDMLAATDVVFIHCDAPACATIDAGTAAKIDAIEQIDRELLGPLSLAMSSSGEPWRLLVTPLHTTLLSDHRESDLPVPFVVSGEKITSVVQRPMTEAAAAEADLQVVFGHELMEFFLKGGLR